MDKQMKMNWSTAVAQLSQQGTAYVLVTVVGVTGSTPRNNGTKMVITEEQIFDSIGGGHLEHKTMKFAHQLLADGKPCQQFKRYKLGTNLGQCCGGIANVLFESFPAVSVRIIVFGAGHVAQALIPMLSELPCQITWVDSRENQFPENLNRYTNLDYLISEQPAEEVAMMPDNSYYIVMTHNHQMDFDICQAILKRADFNYLGLIASETKWRRFQQRFTHRDIEQSQVDRMNCPIGLADVKGKRPMEVAISVAGEVIRRYQEDKIQDHETITHKGLRWKELQDLLTESEVEDHSQDQQNELSLSATDVMSSTK